MSLELRPVDSEELSGEVISTDIASQSVDGFRLVLRNTLQDKDKTMLQVEVDPQDQEGLTLLGGLDGLRFQDPLGRYFPLVDEMATLPEWSHIILTNALDGSAEMTLTLDQLTVEKTLAADGPFVSLSPAAGLRPGEGYAVSQSFSAAGFDFNIEQVRVSDRQGMPEGSFYDLSLDIRVPQAVKGLLMSCQQDVVKAVRSSQEDGAGIQRIHFTLDKFPQDELTFWVLAVDYQVDGPWLLHWRPMTLPGGLAPTPTWTITPQPTLDVTSGLVERPTLAEARRLLQENGSALSGAGWVHMVKEVRLDRNPDAFRPPAGMSVYPDFSAEDAWYLLGPAGEIQKSVTTARTAEGEVWSQVAMLGNNGIDFVSGQTITSDFRCRTLRPGRPNPGTNHAFGAKTRADQDSGG